MTPYSFQKKNLFSLDAEDIKYTNFTALENVSVSIAAGEKIAVIGQSGAGKTTLLRRLYRLQSDRCAFIHQHYALVAQLTVFHNIYMGRLDHYSAFHNLRNLITPLSSHVDEITPIARHLGLEDKLFVKTGELSGGQQQRTGIGRALYRGGSILMADEPVSSLDSVQSRNIMELITDTRKTVISSMHSIDLCRQFFDRIIGLKDKAISFDLSVEDVSTDLLARLYA